MDGSSKELLDRALSMLNDKYDINEDCFFVVMTEHGKNPYLSAGNQTIVGEFNIKTVVPFIVSTIIQMAEVLDISPHDFVATLITKELVASEIPYDDEDEDEDEDEDREFSFDTLEDPEFMN